jgi:hypothetical protein
MTRFDSDISMPGARYRAIIGAWGKIVRPSFKANFRAPA